MAQAGNFQCQDSACGTALVRFGAAGSWLPSSPEAAGEVPPGDSALPVTAMRQGAGPRVSRSVRRKGVGVARLDRTVRLRPATAGPRPGSGGRGAVGSGPNPFLTLRGCSRVGVPRAAPHTGPGRSGPEAETETSAERRRGTMRPAEARAARVGQGGARVAECVCVRLSVNADSPQVIGRAQPARPALRRRPLVGLNTKAPVRPALRVGPVVRAWEAGASTPYWPWDLCVLSPTRAHAHAAPEL